MIKFLKTGQISRPLLEQDDQVYARVAGSLAIFGGLAILPFAVYHFLYGAVLVGWIALLMCICQLVLFMVMRRGAHGLAGAHVLASFHTTASTAVCLLMGISGSFWIFPTTVANYYILPLRSALVFNVVSFVLSATVIFDSPELGTRFVICLLLVNLFGFVFSRRTREQKLALRALLFLDVLTGAANRRALEGEVAEVKAMADRNATPACLMVLDIDRFKRINDERGHMVGDQVLSRLVEVLGQRLRVNDKLFRYGGEEFVVVARGTGEEGARVFAEELRKVVEEHDFGLGEAVTISIGLAVLQKDEPVESWFKRADQAMYQAKAAGRNRVCG